MFNIASYWLVLFGIIYNIQNDTKQSCANGGRFIPDEAPRGILIPRMVVSESRIPHCPGNKTENPDHLRDSESLKKNSRKIPEPIFQDEPDFCTNRAQIVQH